MENSGETTGREKIGFRERLGRFKRLILGLLLLGTVTVACLGAVAYFTLGQIKDSLEPISEVAPVFRNQPVYNQIAFVGNDDNIWYVSPDGQNLRHVTTDGEGYRFPTWAPDGTYLAFVGPDEAENTALYISPTSQSSPTILFNEADSAPFYLYWAPDSHSITFLTQEESGLSMRQANTTVGDSRVLGTGSPFYWVWSPDGDRVLVHVGGSRELSESAHISILKNQEDARRIELNLAPGGFQAPQWAADGSQIFYIAADDEDQNAIYKMDPDTLEQTRIIGLDGFAFMVLSPNGKHIAYLQIEKGDRPPFGTAYIVDTDGQNHRRLTDRPVGSIYWSPDGSKLALLSVGRREDGSTAKAGGLAAPLPQELVFRWLLLKVETGELELLTSFRPTFDFLQTVPYFDQYHLSLTFWSPDSRYFVITKEESDRNQGTIWVYDTTGQKEPRQIGEGTLAVWSWQ